MSINRASLRGLLLAGVGTAVVACASDAQVLGLKDGSTRDGVGATDLDAAGTDGAPPTDAAGRDGSVTPGTDGAVDSDAAPVRPALYPRLVLGNGTGTNPGVAVWNHADALAVDRAPDTTLHSGVAVRAMAVRGSRLFVGSGAGASALSVFDGIDSASPTRAASIASSQLGDASWSVGWLTVASDGSLWVGAGLGIVAAMGDGAALRSTSVARARFHHPWDQIYSAAYDPVGRRLIAAQVSGAGALVFQSPLSRTGDVSTSDWQWTAGSLHHAALVADGPDGGSFYANDASTSVDGRTGSLAIWRRVGATSAARAPDVRISAVAMGLSNSLFDVTVAHDTLVLTSALPARVLIYRNASTLGAPRAPDVTLAHAALDLPVASVLGSDGRLYVANRNSIAIFRNAASSPVLVTVLTTGVGRDDTIGGLGGPRELLLLE